MKVDSVIFDLDGTLWDSIDVVVRAWNKTLLKINKTISKEEIRSAMGLQQPEIAKRLFPGLDRDYVKELMAECNICQCEMLNEEGGILYPNIPETLEKLNSKYPLFIVSNCQCGYIEAFLNSHKLGGYFKDFESSGRTGMSKGDNIKAIAQRNGLKAPVYVGDTEGDHIAADLAGIPFIFASYGFGSVTEFYDLIEMPEDSIKIL